MIELPRRKTNWESSKERKHAATKIDIEKIRLKEPSVTKMVLDEFQVQKNVIIRSSLFLFKYFNSISQNMISRCSFYPKPDLRFGLSDSDYLRSNYVLIINDQQYSSTKNDVRFTCVDTRAIYVDEMITYFAYHKVRSFLSSLDYSLDSKYINSV